MKRVYTHFVCDMPECLASFDAPAETAPSIPPGWFEVTFAGRGLLFRVIACDKCGAYMARRSTGDAS